MNDSCARMIMNIESIGTGPTITLRILQEVKKSEADLRAISRLIMDDPRISAQVLKVANSPVFAGLSRVKNVSQAVVTLGIQNIQQIIFAIELFGTFRGKGIRGKFSEESFWKHSLAGAMIVEELCLADTSIDWETAYLAALLRNIGILAVRQYLSDDFETINAIIEVNSVDYKSASQMILGMNHRRIGHLIAKQWKLPLKIVFLLGEFGKLTDLIAAHNDLSKTEFCRVWSLIDTADAILAEKRYCPWDENYKSTIAVDKEKTDELFNKVNVKVEELFLRLWS